MEENLEAILIFLYSYNKSQRDALFFKFIIIVISVIIPNGMVQMNLLFKQRPLGVSNQQQDTPGCNS